MELTVAEGIVWLVVAAIGMMWLVTTILEAMAAVPL